MHFDSVLASFPTELYQVVAEYIVDLNDGGEYKQNGLNDSNYHTWKGKMKDFLFIKKMHLPLFVTNKPQSMTDGD